MVWRTEMEDALDETPQETLKSPQINRLSSHLLAHRDVWQISQVELRQKLIECGIFPETIKCPTCTIGDMRPTTTDRIHLDGINLYKCSNTDCGRSETLFNWVPFSLKNGPTMQNFTSFVIEWIKVPTPSNENIAKEAGADVSTISKSWARKLEAFLHERYVATRGKIGGQDCIVELDEMSSRRRGKLIDKDGPFEYSNIYTGVLLLVGVERSEDGPNIKYFCEVVNENQVSPDTWEAVVRRNVQPGSKLYTDRLNADRVWAKLMNRPAFKKDYRWDRTKTVEHMSAAEAAARGLLRFGLTNPDDPTIHTNNVEIRHGRLRAQISRDRKANEHIVRGQIAKIIFSNDCRSRNRCPARECLRLFFSDLRAGQNHIRRHPTKDMVKSGKVAQHDYRQRHRATDTQQQAQERLEARRAQCRKWHAARRASETESQAARRRARHNQLYHKREQAKRAKETPEQKEARLQRYRLRNAAQLEKDGRDNYNARKRQYRANKRADADQLDGGSGRA